jgi:hypothetical protein
MLKYIAALALALGVAAGAAHCGHPNSDRHGRAAAAPELPAA